MSDEIRLDRDGPVAIVTLNRPQSRNAITFAMCAGLSSPVEGWIQTRFSSNLPTTRGRTSSRQL